MQKPLASLYTANAVPSNLRKSHPLKNVTKGPSPCHASRVTLVTHPERRVQLRQGDLP
jgi:hypothetical protein